MTDYRATKLVTLNNNLREISKAVSGSYPIDLDPEAHMWRRVTKVCEEAGEVDKALRGYIGENPRKGKTHTSIDIVEELLDTAGAALAAVFYIYNDSPQADVLAMLSTRIQFVHDRLYHDSDTED